jgi:hypothetical protein
MSESSIETQENKQLLWGILMEEGIFDMIPRNVSPNDIQRIFEGVLKNLSNTAPPNLPLMELNRLAIESLVTIIPQAEKYVTISVQDVRNKKRHEIDAKLREKEAESRAFLERVPPPQIDFTDKNISYARVRNPNSSSSSSSHPENSIVEVVDVTTDAVSSSTPLTLTRPKEYNDDINDSPIGEDMDRLIADRIAARERDLAEIAEHIKPPDGYKMDTMIMRQPVQPPRQEPMRVLQKIHSSPSSASAADIEVKPKVRFTDTDTNIVVISNDDYTMQTPPVTSSLLSNHFEVDNIYSRLKRKMTAVPSPPPQPPPQPQPQPPQNNVHEEIINDLRRQILEIKENQKDMFDRLDKLTSYITRE